VCENCLHLKLFEVDAADIQPTLAVSASDIFAAFSAHGCGQRERLEAWATVILL
jgi:hypothetical protein